jgi:dTMP kinase
MKLTVVLVFVLVSALSLFLPVGYAYLLPFAAALSFGVYGIARSVRSKIDPLNDAPNAFRVLLAALGGLLLTMTRSFLFPSVAILLLFGAVFLNDEYQRRAIDSIRMGRRGGSVAFLGIDGSGKSSHASTTERWLSDRGYRALLMPFHRYLFVERLSGLARSSVSGVARKRGMRRRNPVRPLLSLVDNLLLQMSSSLGSRLEGRVILYDRFIWSTYIKYFALGYPVGPLSRLYLLPRPRLAILLDVPVDKSLDVIHSRESHIRYPREVLQTERMMYLGIARERGYPIIDSTADPTSVQRQIEDHLSKHFPVVGGGRKRRSGGDQKR